MAELNDSSCESRASDSVNPRLRNTRRVKPLPYECCGGMCSFFNSGCFSMFCNNGKKFDKKKRRSSSVYERRRPPAIGDLGEKKGEGEDKEISDANKKLIKPNVNDGITDEDRAALGFIDPENMEEKGTNDNEIFISETEIQIGEDFVKDNADEEKDSAFSQNEDLSSFTDDASFIDNDINAKKMNKKDESSTPRKNAVGALDNNWKEKELSPQEVVQLEEINQENSEGRNETKKEEQLYAEEIKEEIKSEKKMSVNERELINIAKIIPLGANLTIRTSEDIKGKEQQETMEKEETLSDDLVEQDSDTRRKKKKSYFWNSKKKKVIVKTDNVQEKLEEQIIQTKETIITDDESIDNENNQVKQDSNASDASAISEVEIAEVKKKTLLRNFTLSKKNKTVKNDVSESSESSEKENKTCDAAEVSIVDTELNTESKRKSLLRSLKPKKKDKHLKQPDVENSSNNESKTDNSDVPDESASDTETIEKKRKTLLRPFSLKKREKLPKKSAEEESSNSFLLCSSTKERKIVESKSSDTSEISYEETSNDKENSSIKIVRNQFFPTEVHTRSGVDNNEYSSDTGNLQESDKGSAIVQESSSSEREKELISVTEKLADDKNENIPSPEIEESSEPILQKVSLLGEEYEDISQSPDSAIKYAVLEKEDFSESLHTLVDNDGTGDVLLVPSSLIGDIEYSKNALKEDENVLPEGIYSTSYHLSVEDSLKGKEDKLLDYEDDGKEITDSTITPTNTLTDSQMDETVIEKSSDTLIEDEDRPKKESAISPEWVDVANVEDLSDEQFEYIRETTIKNIESGENILHGLPDIKNIVETSTAAQDSCERCGNDRKVDDGEGQSEDVPKCVCSSLTQTRPSLRAIEKGSVKNIVDAFNQSEHPMIVPLGKGVLDAKKDDVIISEAHSSPTLGSKAGNKSATPSPIAAKSRTLSGTNSEWQNAEEDIDRLMAMQGRNSLSSLGLRSDSMASVYSGAGEGRYGTVTVRGQVEFGLQYNYKAGALEINVKQCKDLAPVDTKRNRSDPYVKVYLLPDKSKGGKRKTKVKKHTLNPVFDETLKFQISLNGLETRTLWLTVWHSDMFGRNDFLGEVMMTLENKVFDNPTPIWYNLQERTEPFDDTISFKGDIIVCLKFVPPDMTVQKKGKRSRGTLHVLVKEAKYLTAYKANGTSDPFCKSYLLPEKGRNSKQKTPVIKKTVNPVWNHTFVYDDVTLQELAERCLELTVWDHDRLASNEFLGGVRFSLGTGKHYGKQVEWMDATGKELTLWKSMLERPNFWVEGCLSLRPTLDSRTS